MVVLQKAKANFRVNLPAFHAFAPLLHIWRSDMFTKQNASDNAAGDTE